MVKTLKRPGLLLLPCCCSGLRSTSMEQKSLAVNGPRRTLSTQNVTGLNPACDLFWMSYPRCIQSFWPLCCCVCQQSTHVIKMLSCWIYTIPLDHLEAASLSICKTDSKKIPERMWCIWAHDLMANYIRYKKFWYRSGDLEAFYISSWVICPVEAGRGNWSELKGTKSHVLIYSRNRCGIRKGRNKSVVWILPGSFTHRLWHRAFGSRNSINQKNCRTQHSKADSSKGG